MFVNCPYCNSEMKLGYIQSRDGVVWDAKKRKIAAFPSLRSDAIVLGSADGAFSGTSIQAYNCEKCKKIIIDYAK